MEAPVNAAGGSARREYLIRLASDRERGRRNLPRTAVIVVVAPVVVYALVRGAALAANRWLVSSMFEQVGAAGRHEIVDPSSAHLLGLILAACAGVGLASEFWRARQVTEAWRKGFEGEEMTGRALERLSSDYVVFHDLPLPGSRANIDHLVIGPTGVFTVETKHYSSDVVIRRGVARRAGRSMAGVADQANHQAEAMRSMLGCEVRAVVCIQGAAVSVEGWFAKPIVDGVRFCSGRRLPQVLTEPSESLASGDVARLASLVRPRPSASPKTDLGVAPDCTCGSRMVLRRRKTDGAPFWGCASFPACRKVEPVR